MAGIKIDPASATALRKMVEEAERIALISHTAPDGDSVGSSIGFAAMLREKGKFHISVIVPDDIPQYLYCIPGANKVIVHEAHPSKAEKALAEADLVFCMDFNAPHRVAGPQSAYRSSSLSGRYLHSQLQLPSPVFYFGVGLAFGPGHRHGVLPDPRCGHGFDDRDTDGYGRIFLQFF